MRLIDAYALQDEIHKSKMKNPHKDANVAKNHEFEHDHFMWMVTLQPTAQKEIVQCKDCVHWDKGHTEECDNSDSVCFHNGWCKPDWFCADGERSAKCDDT